MAADKARWMMELWRKKNPSSGRGTPDFNQLAVISGSDYALFDVPDKKMFIGM